MDKTISRSEQKRRHKQVEEVAQSLTELTDRDLKVLDCEAEIKAEIKSIRDLKGGARKRQVKHLAGILREGGDLNGIYDFLSQRKGSRLKEKTQLHEAEHLRDTMINEAMEDFQHSRSMQVEWEPDWESAIIGPTVKRFPGLDENSLRKTVYQYVKSHNRLYYRELFRLLKAAIDQAERESRAAGGMEAE